MEDMVVQEDKVQMGRVLVKTPSERSWTSYVDPATSELNFHLKYDGTVKLLNQVYRW